MEHSHVVSFYYGTIVSIFRTRISYLNNVVVRHNNGDLITYSYYIRENPNLQVGDMIRFVPYNMLFWDEVARLWVRTDMLYFPYVDHLYFAYNSINNLTIYGSKSVLKCPPAQFCEKKPYTHLEYDHRGSLTTYTKIGNKYYIPAFGCFGVLNNQEPTQKLLKDDEIFGLYFVGTVLPEPINRDGDFLAENDIKYNPNGCGYFIELPIIPYNPPPSSGNS